jgi:hypothetical protein
VSTPVFGQGRRPGERKSHAHGSCEWRCHCSGPERGGEVFPISWAQGFVCARHPTFFQFGAAVHHTCVTPLTKRPRCIGSWLGVRAGLRPWAGGSPPGYRRLYRRSVSPAISEAQSELECQHQQQCHSYCVRAEGTFGLEWTGSGGGFTLPGKNTLAFAVILEARNLTCQHETANGVDLNFSENEQCAFRVVATRK